MASSQLLQPRNGSEGPDKNSETKLCSTRTIVPGLWRGAVTKRKRRMLPNSVICRNATVEMEDKRYCSAPAVALRGADMQQGKSVSNDKRYHCNATFPGKDCICTSAHAKHLSQAAAQNAYARLAQSILMAMPGTHLAAAARTCNGRKSHCTNPSR